MSEFNSDENSSIMVGQKQIFLQYGKETDRYFQEAVDLICETGVDQEGWWAMFSECCKNASARVGELVDSVSGFGGRVLVVKGRDIGERIGEPDLPKWVPSCIRDIGNNKTIIYSEEAARQAILQGEKKEITEDLAHEIAHAYYYWNIDKDEKNADDINWLREALCEISARDESPLPRSQLKEEIPIVLQRRPDFDFRSIAKEGIFSFDRRETKENPVYQYCRRFTEDKFLPEVEKAVKAKGEWTPEMDEHRLQAVNYLLNKAHDDCQSDSSLTRTAAIEQEMGIEPGTIYQWEKEWREELLGSALD